MGLFLDHILISPSITGNDTLSRKTTLSFCFFFSEEGVLEQILSF